MHALMKIMCRILRRRLTIEEEPDVFEVCEYYDSVSILDDHNYVITDVDHASKIALATLYCVIIVLGLFGNMSVILLYASHKSLRTVHTVFIFSLAASDLLVTFFCMPFNLVTVIQRTWNFGDLSDFACKMVPFMESVAATANLLTLACIAIDRYYAVVHPLEARSFQTLRMAGVMSVFVWVTAVLFALPNLFFYSMISIVNTKVASPAHQYHEETLTVPPEFSHEGSTSYLCYVSTSHLVPVTIYRWVFLCVVFLLPFFVMTIAYVRIGHRLWARKAPGNVSTMSGQTPVSGNAVSPASEVRYRSTKRVIVILVVILSLFFLSWTPTMLYEVIGLSLGLHTTAQFLLIRYYLQWFACSNACTNPILYVFLHDKLKRQIAKSRLGRCCQSAVLHLSSSCCCWCCGGSVVGESNRVVPHLQGNEPADTPGVEESQTSAPVQNEEPPADDVSDDGWGVIDSAM